MAKIEIYGEGIGKALARSPKRARRMVLRGLKSESARVARLRSRADDREALELDRLVIDHLTEAMGEPSRCVWGNLYAPAELLRCFGLRTLATEAVSAALLGLACEERFLKQAAKFGADERLPLYHRAFLGAADSGMLPVPRYAVSAALLSSRSAGTFRHVHHTLGVPHVSLDIPEQRNEASLQYVISQLEELCDLLEQETGTPFDPDRLGEILAIENRTRRAFRKIAPRALPAGAALAGEAFLGYMLHPMSGEEAAIEWMERATDLSGKAEGAEAENAFVAGPLPFDARGRKE